MTNYDRDKLFDIMNTTQMNYANMLKRLMLKKKFSNFILIYYSISLIIYSITAKFYPEYFDEELSSYFEIIISIIVLVFSLINNNANYAERINNAELVMNKVKDIKRELNEDNLNEKKELYDDLMQSSEYRDDLDFFRTVKQQCREINISCLRYKNNIRIAKDKDGIDCNKLDKLNNYLSELNPIFQEFKIILEFLYYSILTITPLIVFIVCFKF